MRLTLKQQQIIVTTLRRYFGQSSRNRYHSTSLPIYRVAQETGVAL